MTSMFGHNIRSDLVLLYLSEAIAVFLAVYLLMASGMPPEYPADHVRATMMAGMLAICSGLVCSASGLYQPELLSRARRLCAGAAMAGILLLMAAWLSLLITTPADLRAAAPGILLELVLGCLGAVIMTRFAFIMLLRGGFLKRRILIVPSGNSVQPERDIGSSNVFEIATLPAGDEALAILHKPDLLRAQRVWAIVADQAVLSEEARRTCHAAGIRVLDESEYHECRLNRIICETLAPDWLSSAQGLYEGWFQRSVRRGFDLSVSLFLLMLTFPVMVATALIIKFDSPGPVLYRQQRVGQSGRIFTLIKFRSMVMDAEAGGVARWATLKDTRVTRFGRLIRLTRIDELPQIFNVLSGDMSIVGPRPERPSFVEELGKLIPHYHDRGCVKPGITGWAQVNYPYGASVEDARMKLAYDLYYVRHRSLFLDFLILVATVRVVLLQEGAR
jgi:exopolysaccharide biosynthesis polyprenyl glycosylphosphotransferase